MTAAEAGCPVCEEQVAVVARTLRWVAGSLIERGGEEEDSGRWYAEIAEELERDGVAALGHGCCPACQEVVCDEDCPLALVRA